MAVPKIVNKGITFLSLLALTFGACETPEVIDDRDNYVGQYEVWEITTNPTTQNKDTLGYLMQISKSSNEGEVFLDAEGTNFLGTGCSVAAEVVGSQLTVSSQICNAAGIYQFEGSGTLTISGSTHLLINLDATTCNNNTDCPPDSTTAFVIDALKF